MNRRRFLSQGTLYAGIVGIAHAATREGLGLAVPGQVSQDPGADSVHRAGAAQEIDLREAVIVSRPGHLPNAERTSATVLAEEVEKRTGIRLATSITWPEGKPVIAVTSADSVPAWNRSVPERQGADLAEKKPEGYRLYVNGATNPPVVWVVGADARGALFGVGDLLRRLNWAHGKLAIASDLDIATAPAYEIRGHQLGYRPHSNSYDAWSPAQFEQYIRELTFFGANTVEGIPFQENLTNPLMKFSRREINRAIGEICYRYGIEYWAWIPADFDLKDKARRQKLLQQCEQFFQDTPEFTGFSFPGGDPGNNPPELVLPFLEDIAKLLAKTHPKAKIWLSLQHFSPSEVDYTFHFIDQRRPTWLGGLVGGPGSPPLGDLLNRLPRQYGLRDYPDIGHNKLCQYEVEDWDQAYALTEGREAINPRPVEYAAIFGRTAPYTNGFSTYSEGVNDDVNKTIWSSLGWDPNQTPREILIDYARVFFSPSASGHIADAILALEKNWHGPLIDNGAVEATFLEWRQLAKALPNLESNWRWQMCLLRANYDAYIRRRLINETRLESEANATLANSQKLGAERAVAEATDVLNRAVTQPISVEVRRRISQLCAKLFHSIGLQTSVKKYHALNGERGAVLDYVDYPMNNRWWLEDQFKTIRTLGSENEKNRRLHQLATWEHPGLGSYYDDMGNIANSPHVVRCDPDNSPQLKRHPTPTFWWWDNGKSRARLSWQVTMWPSAIVYVGIDPSATYRVRTTGYGQARLRINGERVEPTLDGKKMGEFKEFPVAAKYLKNRKLVLTWDRPLNEENLNWRKQSRLAEVWLLKNASSAPQT